MTAKKLAKVGDWVAVEYEGKFEDGNVFDSNIGKEPLIFNLGLGMVIKGFDTAVQKMSVDDELEVKIKPDETYGPRREDAIEIPKESFGSLKIPKEDKEIEFMSNMGPMLIKVVKVEGNKVKAIINHPLAGKTLIFKIKLKKILTKKEAEDIQKEMNSCGSSCDSGCDHCHH